MGLHTATPLNRWVKSAEEKTIYAGRFNIGPRLIFGFVLIILSMLAADAVVLWQFHLVQTQAERLNGVDQKLVAVQRVYTSLLAFHDRLEDLADSQDVGRLVAEGGSLRAAVLQDTRRAMSALSLPPFGPRRDPTILPTLHVIQSALPSQLEIITTLATAGDWRAVHLRLANEVTPLETLTATLVENVDHEVGEEQAQTVRNIKRVQRLVFVMVPLTALVTLLIAATLGVAITRSITRPLARLVEGAKALARGEFQHQVSVSGNDELAHLGQVFNDTARRLRDLYATLQSSEDRLRLVIDTIPAYAWSARPDGSVDFVNRRFLEFIGRPMEELVDKGWGSFVHPDDLTRYVGEWHATVASGEPMESEARVRRMDGDYRWLLIRNVPLRDALGNIVNWYGTAIDIEERHRAEDALRRSEAYLAEAQRLSRTGSFGWKPSTGVIIWSAETFRIFQYDRSMKPTVELVLQRVHPEDVASVKETVARASQDGKDFEHEYRLVMPDGTVKHVHVVAHGERDASGEIGFVGAVMDVSDRERAEETLRRSEGYLAQGQRLTQSGSWAWNVRTGVRFWSQETFRIFGCDPETVKPTWEDILERTHPDDRAAIVQKAQQETTLKEDSEFDWRIVLPDGRIRHLHSISHPVLDESGEITEIVGTLMDVTERKQAEETLRQSEAYLAEAQRLSHTGSWAWNLVTNLQFWSVETFRIYGFDSNATTPTRQSFLERVHPDDRASIELVETELYKGNDAEYNYRIILPGGSIKHITSVAHPIRNDSGQVIEFVGTVMDVTERRLAEEERERVEAALRRSESYLAEAQRLTHTGSWAWRVSGREALHLSEEWYRIYGFAPEEGLPAWEKRVQRMHPEDRAKWQETINRAIGEKSDYEVEQRLLLPDGTLKYTHTIGHPVLNASGGVVQFVGTTIDVTERKRADEERERLRQARAELAHINRVTTMGELTASLAHEVNQPIAATVTSAHSCIRWLEAGVPNLDKARASAARIVKDGTRAGEIISRIRLLFQKGTPQLELVDVNEVIEEMIVLLRSEATRYAIFVRWELAADLPPVMGDRVQLQQVMMNLIINSIDAMKAVDGTRELTIKSQRGENGQLLVSVSDTGVGLPPQQAEQIFNAFFTTKPHGTGMGLRISRSIVESHGGQLWAADNPPRGATFCLTLPANSEAHA